MAINTDLQVFYPLSSGVDDLANGDNGTNSGISFSTHSGVLSADYAAQSYFAAANSTYNFSFGTGDFTFSVWVNPDTINYGSTAQGTLFGTDYPNYELAIYQSKIQCFIGGPGNLVYTTGAAVTAGSWQHVIIRRSGTTVEILVDNSLQAATLGGSPGTANMTASGSPQFQAGRRVSSANNFYDGKMSDVCMWKRALTNAEVTSIYSAGAGNFSTLLPGPSYTLDMIAASTDAPSGEVGFEKGDEEAFHVSSDSSYSVYFYIAGAWDHHDGGLFTVGMTFAWPDGATRGYIQGSAADQTAFKSNREIEDGFMYDTDDADNVIDKFKATGVTFDVSEHQVTVSGTDDIVLGVASDFVQIIEGSALAHDYAVSVGASTTITPPIGKDGMQLVIRIFKAAS